MTFDPGFNPIYDILLADDEEPTWLIPEIILQGSIVAYAGEEGVGKSFVSYVMALAMAAGCEGFSGLIPAGEPKRVVYFDEENSSQDMKAYIRRAWTGLMQGVDREEREGYEDNLMGFWPVSGHLGTDDWPDRVAEWIDFHAPHVMFFDTANPCFDIENENDNAKAQQIVATLKRLRTMTDPEVTMVILKHAKIRTQRGRRRIRGAKAWGGAVDQVMFQVKATGRPRADGLSLTRLEKDKTRAYGLRQHIYITPQYTDAKRSGLILDASYTASTDHKNREEMEEEDLEITEGGGMKR